MQARELRESQRQLPVTPLARAEQETVTRAVHRLHAELFALFRSGEQEEVTREILVVTRGLVELGREDLRAHDFFVAVSAIQPAHVVDERVVEREPLREIERRALRPLVELEELELRADAAVIALLRRFEPREVLVE